ncbi:metalloregulator ArsR/SmtB family transcription factor [Nocardioides sp. KR10-350]|uniref:ArsR/SmtB family transcription factor n=1 Tax=Nocardioides cheoyonin TaxID=3156615 RepID=UPI0032B5F0F8
MGHIGEGSAGARAELDATSAKSLAATLQALASSSRLLILDRLRRAPSTVGELAESVGMEQPAVSQQLRILRNLGLVTGEREGRSIVYELYDDHVAELLDQALYHAEHLRHGDAGRRGQSAAVNPHPH